MKSFLKISALACLSLLLTVLVGAQGEPSRLLTPGVTVTGVINPANPAQVYTFVAPTSAPITLNAVSDSDLALTIIVTDSAGNLIAQGVDTGRSGAVSLVGVPLPAAGLHYVTVFPAPGVTSATSGNFNLTLQLSTPDEVTAPQPTDVPAATEPEAVVTEEPAAPADDPAQEPATVTEPVTETPPAITPETFRTGQYLSATGLQVSLSWNNTSDMNLQVRDPEGQTLFFDSRTTTNGGTFGFDVNGLCQVLTADNPTETATWAPGAVPTGSYEILIYYRQDCENNGPTTFTVNVSIDGRQLEPITATLNPPVNNIVPVYIASFRLNDDGTIVAETAGLYQDTLFLPKPAAEFLSEPAQVITPGSSTLGVITTSQYYQLYQFEGRAGESYEITMTAQSGNLDTLLLVLNDAGRIVADNDDIIDGVVTDSAIDSPPFRAAADGIYTIIATRYGKDVGGTEGVYELTISGSAVTELPDEVAQLNVSDGDIQIYLTWNTTADLRLLVRDPAGLSVFNDRREIPSGGRLERDGNINCRPPQGTAVSYVFWPLGTLRGGAYEIEIWHRNPCNDPQQQPVVFNLFVVVDNQVVLSDSVPVVFGDRYVTSFNVDAFRNVQLGEGGLLGGSETLPLTPQEIASAPEIISGQVQTGFITQDNKYDLYYFDGVIGQTVTITMRRTQGSLDTKLFLLDPNGFEIADNDDAVPGETTDSLIADFVLPQTGRYTIIATHFATIFGGTTGSYELSLEIR